MGKDKGWTMTYLNLNRNKEPITLPARFANPMRATTDDPVSRVKPLDNIRSTMNQFSTLPATYIIIK